jgi:hypothetical protein
MNMPVSNATFKLDLNQQLGQVHSGFVQARADAMSAWNLLNGLTDGGVRPDLLADVNQDYPWIGSSTLRDELLLSSPLSDEVLLAVILRKEPMDMWHITQVMLANTPLNGAIVSHLRASGILNTLFFNVVSQAQAGQGLSAKQLLEQELVHRRKQQARALTELGYLWATDTVNPGGLDSLQQLIDMDAGLNYTWQRLAHALETGAWSTANTELEQAGGRYSGHEGISYAVSVLQANSGVLNGITTEELDSLSAIIAHGDQGAAWLAGRMPLAHQDQILPEPIFPGESHRPVFLEQAGTSITTSMQAFPDPADGFTVLRFPPEDRDNMLLIYDAQGREVKRILLTALGAQELSTADLAPGVYTLAVQGTSLSTRLVVQR